MTTDLYAQADRYGVAYEGTLVGPEYHDTVDYHESYRLADLPRGAKVTRIRMIGGDYIPGRGKCYDISYVHATLADGTIVPVTVDAPSWSLIPRRLIKSTMVAWAKEQGVFAKALGLLDDGVYSILG